MSGAVAADWVRAAVERRPVLRASTQLPYLFIVVYGLASARHTGPWIATLLIAAAAVVLFGMAREFQREHAPAPDRERALGRWRAVSVVVGTALLAPGLVIAMEVDVPTFSVAVALMLLNMGALLPPRVRIAAGTWTLAVWSVTLWWSGVRDPVVLLQLVGASAVVFVVAVVTSDTLARAATREAQARIEAAGSARLLESQLGARSLDVDGVARSAAQGLRQRGFSTVIVRLLDRRAGIARPIAASGLRGERAAPRPIDAPPLAGVIATSATQRVVRPDGRSTLHLPLHDDGGVVAVVEATMRRRSDEADLIDAAKALALRAERALARARSFERDERDREELVWLDQRTNDLVSTVSHELRTPMTVIAGLGETLESRWGELGPTVRTTLLDRIAANADRLASIVGSLIDSGALEDGQLRPDRQVVALRPLVDAVLDRLELLTASHVVSTEFADDLYVRVDPALLEHVLENLLVNVADHTPAGTVVVVSSTMTGDGGERVAISVTDDGPGILDTDIDHVFERFFRGGDPDRRSSGGLGLGLPLARQIVRAHGGDLVAERVGVDGGTRFRFTVEAASGGDDDEAGDGGDASSDPPGGVPVLSS